jgi:long-subunit acyl-CoA synthetase (AMP-forming)
VALHAAATPALLIGEWAVLASKGVAVIVPRSFSPDDLTETLVESKSRLAIVDRLATAYHLAGHTDMLPDLKYIVCFEGTAQAQLPIMSWTDFLDSGRMEPDRSTALLRTISDKDTALLFYYKDQRGARQAMRYTHALLLEHIARIESMLGAAAIRNGELVLTATAWEHAVGHIASCYVPAIKQALVQITHAIPDISLFENSPQVVVGDAAFFDGVRQNIVRHVRQSGQVESAMLNKALSLSKSSFESPKGAKNLSPLPRIQRAFLQGTIVSKVQKMLGGRLRLFIGTDDEAHYETQLFFHTFGIELIELPQEVFK